MKSLPLAARLYVGAVIAAGGLLLTIYIPLPQDFTQPIWFVGLLLLSAVTSAFKVNLPLTNSGSTMSVSYAVDFLSLLLLGPHQTMLVAAASAWSQCTFRMSERNPVYRTLFSMSCLTITVQVAGLVFTELGGSPGHLLAFGVLGMAKPLVGAAVTYFLVNTALIATAIGLSTRQKVVQVWNENFLWSAPSYFVGAAAAGGVALVTYSHSAYWVAPLGAAPLYLTYRTYKIYLGRIEDEQRHVQQMSDLHLATIEALALAIDAKDQTAHTHIRRVQSYAASLARSVGMTENEIQGVKTGALLHDIGKLAVPEHILSKPGPLTQEEFQKIKVHPQVGAEIIAAVPFPYPVAPIILSHHERWDGKGYPAGLKGEEIPLGARILAVVDYYDALTSERPYHKAMTSEAAIGLLTQEAGKALDPDLVTRFIDMLPAMHAEAEATPQSVRTLSLAPVQGDRGRPAAGFSSEQASKSVFDDIALAHREIYALYEIAQAMGTSLGVADTMALISSKLSSLVPFSCCALFLHNEETETLRCRFATGTDAEIVQNLTVRNGHGLTGWVARNRRPLVNARPSADLEAGGLESTATALQSALVCPLVINERFIGTLSVYHIDAGCYTDDHRRLLDRVCEQAAAVIYNSIVFEQTQEDSLTDPLTGLPNTRSMFMHLTRELARSERLKQQVSLLVMDLDHFKQINDNHGHHVGDRALREIAAVLRAAIRPYDICVRYAGDEFIVVLSGCGAEEAEQKRLELQQAIDEVVFEVRPGNRLPLGISIGAAVFPQDGDTYETLLATADGRMYRDKTKRKGRLVRPPGAEDSRSATGEPSEAEIRRAAAGIL
ncbi:MAG TPA: HD domain-containing phosphohydrolase [Vicinamibacterales bacterium]|jgi:diguanylate cyclase (GGDEF)-like protein/putative nucleotidyltransferase with HDIG domain